jgi:hypothetical protein
MFTVGALHEGMEEFRFENTLTLTESQYLAVWSVLSRRWRSRIIRVGALTAFGIVLLFSKYTLLLGVILLGLVLMSVILPGKILPVGTRSLFRRHRYLRDALTYGVSDQKLWVKGARIDASVSWSMLVTWREIEDWLVLSPSGIPPVYLSLARLREEGLYGRVRALAASNAPEYNTSSPSFE